MHQCRPDGRLKAEVTVGSKRDGSPKKRYVYAKSERALKQKVEKVKFAALRGELPESGPLTVAQLLDLWRERHVARKEPKTQQMYGYMMNYIKPVIGAAKVKDLSPLQVEYLLDQHRDKVSGTTLHQIYSTLKAALRKGKRWRLVTGDNPCDGVDPPAKSTKRRKPFDQEEIQTFLAAAKGEPLYPLYLLAIWTGLREGELLGLQWADIDGEKGWLQVRRSLEGSKEGTPIFGDPKTEASDRAIPLSPILLDALREHRSRQQVQLRLNAGAKWKDFDLVFTTRTGGPINPSNLRNREFYPLLERAGLRRIRFHDLRHTTATVMLSDLGFDVKTVQALLGHSTARTTLDTYGHARDHKKKEAVRGMDSLLTASNHNDHSR